MSEKSMHWADQTARKIVDTWGEQEIYTCASGITPSGVVHIGNFREIITVDLIVRALRDMGKIVRFIYSWDDFDTFRKVPKDMPQQELLKSFLRQPIVDVPDPFGVTESYARHNELEVESVLPRVGINPEFIYQNKMYRAGKYADGIKLALQNTSVIKSILDEYRKEPLSESWLPVSVFDPETNTDEVTGLRWDGDDTLTYVNKKGVSVSLRISEGKYIKLPWRVDWPMRWSYEQVVFEPGGKDHSSEGGSYTTGQTIAKKVFNRDAPLYIMYDFISIKGGKGKMSSSAGGAVKLSDVLEVYEPEIVRYLFAGTRPGTEFNISFDADVIKIYEDFDRCERISFGQEDISDKDRDKQKRIYALSCVDAVPNVFPRRPSFRHLSTIVQLYGNDVNKTVDHYVKDGYNEDLVRSRATCVKNWLEKYAPEEFVFKAQSSVPETVKPMLTAEIKIVLEESIRLLKESDDEVFVGQTLYDFCKTNNYNMRAFFQVAYTILLNKSKGPRLFQFIYLLGKQRAIALFEDALKL